MDNSDTSYRKFISSIADEDVCTLMKKDQEYGASWKKRGGVGAYMVMIRKVDRLEEIAKRFGYDIFAALRDNSTGESLLDTIRDLRCYLDLIEAEFRVHRGDLLSDQQKQDRELGEVIARTYHPETRTLTRCNRCRDFHLHPDDCPQDPGPAHP